MTPLRISKAPEIRSNHGFKPEREAGILTKFLDELMRYNPKTTCRMNNAIDGLLAMPGYL